MKVKIREHVDFNELSEVKNWPRFRQHAISHDLTTFRESKSGFWMILMEFQWIDVTITDDVETIINHTPLSITEPILQFGCVINIHKSCPQRGVHITCISNVRLDKPSNKPFKVFSRNGLYKPPHYHITCIMHKFVLDFSYVFDVIYSVIYIHIL